MCQPQRRMKEELEKLLDIGFIYPISDNEWVSPIVLVPKKKGKWSTCVDYGELNKATKRDHFSLPFIDQVFDGLQFDLTIIDKPGKENVVADFLSRISFPTDEEGMVDDQIPDEHLFYLSILSLWFFDIVNYLVATKFPPNLSSSKKRNIVSKSTPFTLVGGNIFKLGPYKVLRRCFREEEVFDILLACHDGPSGGHFTTKRIVFKVLQTHYYCPTLHQVARRCTSRCDQC
eukprot:PITA_31771